MCIRDRVKPVTVKVKDAAPGTPVLSADNWDGDGSYTLTADMWWGTNATSYRLYEDGVLISEGDMVANSPTAQRVTVPVSGRSVGKHTYRVEFVNAAGSTESKALTVTVKR